MGEFYYIVLTGSSQFTEVQTLRRLLTCKSALKYKLYERNR
jgi:hypothetical protein